MPTRLSEMVFDEVSLVTRGANQESLVALFKSDVDKAGRPRMISCPAGDCDGKFPMGTKNCPTCGSTVSYTSKNDVLELEGINKLDWSENPDYDVNTILKRQFTNDKRQEMADKGQALPDNSFPVEKLSDLENAIQSWGRCPAAKRPALKNLLTKMADKLDAPQATKDTIAALAKASASFAAPGGNGRAGKPVMPNPNMAPVQEGVQATNGHVHSRSTSSNAGNAGASGTANNDGGYCQGCGAPLVGSQDPNPGDDSQNLTKRAIEKIKSIFKSNTTLTPEEEKALEDVITNPTMAPRIVNEPDPTGGKSQVPTDDKVTRPADDVIGKLDHSIKAWLAHVEKSDTDAKAKVEALKEENDTLKAQAEVGKSDDPIADAIAKADPKDRPLLERLAKQSKEASELAKAEQDRRINGEFIVKYGPIAKSLSVSGDTLGPIMKRASESLSKEDFEEVERVFKSASEVVKSSNLMRVQGMTGSNPATGSSAVSKLNAAAGEIRKSDPKLSREQAEAAALSQDPALYSEYMAERRSAASVAN